jgi:hypothetical protein
MQRQPNPVIKRKSSEGSMAHGQGEMSLTTMIRQDNLLIINIRRYSHLVANL